MVNSVNGSRPINPMTGQPDIGFSDEGLALFSNTQSFQSPDIGGYGAFSQPFSAALGQTSALSPQIPFLNNSLGSSNTYNVSPEAIQRILGSTSLPAQGQSFSQEDLMSNVTGFLKQISDISNGVDNIAFQTAQQKALSAFIDSYLEAESTKRILQMNNQSTQANAVLDEQQLEMRQNYNILSKQMEQYTLDAQGREQLYNIFFTMEKTIMDNRFSLSKSVVNSMKY